MAFKQFEIRNIGTVTIYKRAGARSLRLSVRPDGTLRITIPTWTPYAVGINFAKSRANWIQKHAKPPARQLRHGQMIGKSHRLYFKPVTSTLKVSTRVKPIEVVVSHPISMPSSTPAVQKAASIASIRALRSQAEKLLPIRLRELAEQYGFTYRSIQVKQLKSRWGSCDQHANIVLNLFLIQLPWPLIDYVLLHELTHTRVMQHGPKFWQAMESIYPQTKALRKQIRAYQPVLFTSVVPDI